MKLCDLTYDEAFKRHPSEVERITLKLRRGKSKARLIPAQELEWSYECCVRIEGSGSLADVLSGAMSKRLKKEAQSIDALVEDEVRRTGTVLKASLGRWGDSAAVHNPPEVAIKVRERLEADAQEKARFNALTPEQQNAERNELLRQLSRSPGFMCVSIPGSEQ